MKQRDITDCGAACLATICKQHGLGLSVAKIREIAGTDKHGTNAYGLIKAAEKLGFTAKGVRGDRDALFSKFPLPAIAHVIVDGSLFHYVVIHKIAKKKIVIADPAKGIVALSPEDFLKQWTGILILLVPNAQFKRGDQTQGMFQRFFGLLLPQRNLIVSIFLASLMYTLLGILGAFYFKFLMDEILPNQLFKTLHMVSIGIILLNIFKIILGAFRSHLLLYLSQKLDIALVLGYFNHVLQLPMNFFTNRKVGEVISRLMDASKVREAISGATLTIMIDTLMVIAAGVILCMQNIVLFGISLAIVVIYGLVVLGFNIPIRNINQEQMENNAQLTSYLVESLSGIETLKSFNAESRASFETEKRFIKLIRSVFKGGWLANLSSSLTSFVASLGGIVILWVGSFLVLNGAITLGQLITFNALLAYFLDPVKNLINLQPMMHTAIVASDRLGEILDLESEKLEDEDRKVRLKALSGKIEIKDLDFRYGMRQPVLQGINLEINPGETVALVGESGSGKTTLAKLILNFFPFEKGEIILDGYHIQDLNKEFLRDQIGYISQDIFLFNGTILENLCLGLEGIDFEKVISVAKAVGAHEFITKLPFRYQTMIAENGVNLSGGQRQLLGITRALLKEPDILVLDEATSNLDSFSERAVQKALQDFRRKGTTIIIAHRLSTVRKCDKIFVLANGRIIETGSHEQLLSRKGHYYQLFMQQYLVEGR